MKRAPGRLDSGALWFRWWGYPCDLFGQQHSGRTPAQQPLGSALLPAALVLPQQDLQVTSSQHPLPFCFAHILPFLPLQQAAAVCLSLASLLQQGMSLASLPSQHDMELADLVSLPWQQVEDLPELVPWCSQQAQAGLSAFLPESVAGGVA